MRPNDPRSDQNLIAALNSGDASAFDAMYYRYRDRILRLAYRFTGHHDDALDVLQETFAYFFGKFPGFHLTSSLTTFLYPAVRNLSLEARRKRMRSAVGELPLDLPGFATVETDAMRADLATAMSSLPAAQRDTVLLRFVDDLTIEEIAAATGVPAGTVKSRLHHAIAAMKQDPKILRYFA